MGARHISTGTIAYDTNNDDYTVSGDYTFGQAGSYPVQVQVFDTSGDEPSATTTIQVNPGAISVTPAVLSLSDMTAGNTVLVARFTDSNPAVVSA